MAKLHNRSDITENQKYSDFLHPSYWPVWAGIGGLWLLTRLPLSVQIRTGRMLGDLVCRFARGRRRITRTNIDLCYPEMTEAEKEKLVRNVFRSYGQGLMETASAWLRGKAFFENRVTFEGLEYIQHELDQGKGILLAGSHFAVLDLAGALFGLKHPFYLVHRSHDNPLFNYFMTRARLRFAEQCIGRKDIRGMVRTLKQGNMLWYAPDQDFGRRNSVFVPFFGIQTATITATSKLANLGGVRVIPSFCYRRPDNTYVLKAYPPLDIPSGDESRDAALYNEFLEARAKEFPDQYLWLHKRFKTRPEGEKSFYS